MERAEYYVNILVNNIMINKVIIDPHYQVKHSESIDDQIILALVNMLNGTETNPQAHNDGFAYHVSNLIFNEKAYRLIWILEDNQIYLGVVNAFRR